MYVIRDSSGVLKCVAPSYAEIIPQVQTWFRREDVHVKECIYHCKGKWINIYGNVYVSFSRTGKQLGVYILPAQTVDNLAMWFDIQKLEMDVIDDMGGDIDCLSMDKFILSNGWVATWTDEDSAPKVLGTQTNEEEQEHD